MEKTLGETGGIAEDSVLTALAVQGFVQYAG
jgi:hypothetical protein